MRAIFANLLPPLMIVGMIAPPASIAAAVLLFIRHRERVEPERRVPVLVFVLAIIFFGALWGYFGLMLGLEQACPEVGNLCGLWPALVTGPIAFALAVFLVGVVVWSIEPAPRRDADNSH